MGILTCCRKQKMDRIPNEVIRVYVEMDRGIIEDTQKKPVSLVRAHCKDGWIWMAEEILKRIPSSERMQDRQRRNWREMT